MTLPNVARYTLPLVVAVAVFWIAFDDGTYGLTSRSSLALVVWWAVVLLVSLRVWPSGRIPREALVAGGLLTAFAAWTGLSILWAESAEKAFNEFNRVALYLGVFAIAVLSARNGRAAGRWAAGMAIGVTSVALLALASRFLPDMFSEPRRLAEVFPEAERRLSYPVNYWNGLAAFVGFAFPLLLHFAASARSLLVRGLALAPVPALVAAVYLTSSRGGSLATLAGTLTFIALTGRRWATVGALALAVPASAGAVAVLAARPGLVDHPFSSAVAVQQGRSAALLVTLLCVATGAAYAVGVRFAPRPPRMGPVARSVAAVLGVLLVAAAVIAVDPRERVEAFTKPASAELKDPSVEEHLLSAGGRGRWQMWEAAVDEFRSAPVLGGGAGSYEAWWAEHRPILLFVRDAHSLYLEVLGELGVVGFSLLLAFFALALFSAARRIRRYGDEPASAVAAFTGVFAVFAVEAAVDWAWEFTTVAVVAIAALGLLTGPATIFDGDELRDERRRGRGSAAVRLAGVAAAWFVIACQTVPLLAQVKIGQSEKALQRGDANDALEDAFAARELQPWASSPHLQVALVEERLGDIRAARASIDEAIEHDDSNWRLWLVKARIETKAGRFQAARESLSRAAKLNPRSPLFLRLRRPT